MKIGSVLISLASVVAFVCEPVGTQAESAEFAASWWRGLSSIEQGAAVVGAIDGYRTGVQHGIIEGIAKLAKGPTPKNMGRLTAHKYYTLMEQTTLLANSPRYSHSVAFYVAEVTEFYNRYPSAHSIRIGAVAGCLADNPTKGCDKLADTGSFRDARAANG